MRLSWSNKCLVYWTSWYFNLLLCGERIWLFKLCWGKLKLSWSQGRCLLFKVTIWGNRWSLLVPLKSWKEFSRWIAVKEVICRWEESVGRFVIGVCSCPWAAQRAIHEERRRPFDWGRERIQAVVAQLVVRHNGASVCKVVDCRRYCCGRVPALKGLECRGGRGRLGHVVLQRSKHGVELLGTQLVVALVFFVVRPTLLGPAQNSLLLPQILDLTGWLIMILPIIWLVI
jgi:hypothetical protein